VTSSTEWDALVTQHDGTFFHKHAFLSTIADGLGLTLDLRAAVADGTPVGAVPLVLKRLGPLTTVNWLPFPYVGPLVPPTALASTLTALRRYQRRRRCVRAQHILLDEQPTGFDGYACSVDRTFTIPLTGRSDDDLLSSMNVDRRRVVRRAMRNGMQIRSATQGEVTDLLPRLFAVTFEQQNLPAPYGGDCFRLVWERLAGHPDVLCHTAVTQDGEPVAIDIAFAGGRSGLGWVAGRTMDKAGSDAFVALFWHALRWARDRGCREFDLVGAPTEAIAEYKRSLGGQERRYTVLRRQARTHRAAMKLLAHRPESRFG
jgi:hypothetical protein